MSGQRTRFWIEAGLAVTTGFLAVLTVVWRDWIEAALRVDPDRHSGSLEWLIVAALAVATCTLIALARAEWRSPALHAWD
jgi:hypothetical protein